MTPEQIARFWAKVDKSGECWLWTGARKGNGYGNYRVGNKHYSAHRLAWELEHGPIPPGKNVCHDCPGGDNPLCVRHLWLGTQAENNADRSAKGRSSRHIGEVNRKLRPETVQLIRAKYAAGNTTYPALAQEFGCCPQHIWGIVSGRSWRHLNSDVAA